MGAPTVRFAGYMAILSLAIFVAVQNHVAIMSQCRIQFGLTKPLQ